ncbi:MAG: 16S rRNA (cytidine(1402)-2'-O)-methyltransferase [Vicinamibacterales bacterium]
MPGSLYVVATPIGNLEDITLRALRVLREVAIIAAEDTRRTAKLLSHYSISTPTTSVHAHNEHRRIQMLLDRLAAGDDVALVSDAGTPGVSDPGRQVVAAALERGFSVVAVPGPSAVVAALVSSGFRMDSFLFAGFPPRRVKAREEWLRRLAEQPCSVIFFEAPHRIRETLSAAQPIFGIRPIAVAKELTKIHEKLVIGPTSDVLRVIAEPRGEYTIVVSPASSGSGEILELPEDRALLSEFGRLTDSTSLSRRDAVARLSARYRMPQRQVYDAIERAKKSVG